MKKTKNTIIASTRSSDEVELPVDYEDLILLDEPLVFTVKYKGNRVSALYNEFTKQIFVFDSEIKND